jgi:uncharacterized protein (TIGR02265 family)
MGESVGPELVNDQAEFHPPRVSAPIDLERHLRELPPDATCRGLFFADPIERLGRAQPGHPILRSGEIGGRRYLPFRSYPYADYMRLMHDAARALHPREPVGEGLRRVGRGAYTALLSNQIGRVMFGVFGRSFDQIVRMGARGYGVSVSFGSVRVEERGERHIRYHFEDFPAFIETVQVGIVEGAMDLCEVEGEVRVKMRGLAHGTFDVRWATP